MVIHSSANQMQIKVEKKNEKKVLHKMDPQHIPFLVVYFIFSHCTISTLFLFHKHTKYMRIFFLLLPTDYGYVYLFFLTGPGPLHKITVSTFSCNPLARIIMFSFIYLSQPPVYFFFFLPAFSFFSIILLLSSTPQMCPWTVSLRGFLLFSSRLFY